MIYFVVFEESYTWSFFILIRVLFVLIQVLFSYPGPIYSAHFLKNSDFFQVFPIFPGFLQVFLMQSGVFFRMFLTQGMLMI